MKPELHAELLKKIEELKELVEKISLEFLINFINKRQFEFNHGRSKVLSSPFQQGTYLLGLAASQKEPENPIEFSKSIEEKICSLLNSIFNLYTFNYFDIDQNNGNNKIKEIAMSAFIHYFFTSKTLDSHQIKEWILFWFKDYSQIVKEYYNFTVEDLIDFSFLLEEEIQNNVEEGRNELIKIKKISNKIEYQERTKNFFENSLKVFSIEKSKILQKMSSDKVESILSTFALKRGEAEEITYITDKNPISFKSLFVQDERVYYVVNNSFFISIINLLEVFLYKQVKNSQKIIQERDNKLEVRTSALFKEICSPDAIFYESIFENANSRNEHDLVIYDKGILLIVEAKASPPKEPMRDADKAFIKIRDHFKSSSGLQKAFEQANGLKKHILKEKKLDLFNKKGKILATISLDEIKTIHTICVTRDDFGALGCNLNYLLDKSTDDTYPWVIDIANLDSIVKAWKHLNLKNIDFYHFLSQRTQLHNKVLSMDELEYVGAFLKYKGGLQGFIDAKADYIPLAMEEGDIFDEIYFCSLEGKKFELKKIPLSLHSVKREDIFGVVKDQKNKKSKLRSKSKMQKKSRSANRKK
ncbi:hypothetical protein FJV16_13925 [Acinetobacter baumannii]|uniref:hypothetical protein n=1 Tax=Acinetobacter baumannii TaxID=470 RepID=UPI0011272A83|nr:hypothetical protein [Acinetobacter baumannii]TPR85895.1 hypothetical protein FJV16_13925 [Acinetobacter baumannii]